VKGFKKCICDTVDGTDGLVMMNCGVTVKRFRMLAVSVKKLKAQTVKTATARTMMERAMLISDMFFVLTMKLIVKYFFLADLMLRGLSWFR
jgi:hypothetical protein